MNQEVLHYRALSKAVRLHDGFRALTRMMAVEEDVQRLEVPFSRTIYWRIAECPMVRAICNHHGGAGVQSDHRFAQELP